MTSRTGATLALGLTALLAAAAVTGQSQHGSVKVCRDVPVPDGYVIVALATSPLCPNGAYLIKKEEPTGAAHKAGAQPAEAPQGRPPASRPRRAGGVTLTEGESAEGAQPADEQRPVPTLGGAAAAPTPYALGAAAADQPAGPEEVGEGEVVRVETTLVTVPVSVSDRDGRFVPDLAREDFLLSEDGVEQEIAYFEEMEKPFTVALMLDTSGSTVFKLQDIKDAAIRFAGQLRPQDRVLVVTFNDDVLLLTEATNDRAVIDHVIERHAQSSSSTRLYDALDLLVKKRLNKIKGRKAIVLFTDGVDTGSDLATYRSTLETAEELDALIYPIQYDTLDDNVQAVGGSLVGRPDPGDRGTGTSRVQLGSSSEVVARVMREAYALGGKYLQALADKTGGRLYRADDPAQLARAFSLIAEELRHQYSLGYYPRSAGSAASAAGTRRQIRVRVRRVGLAVRARDSYVTAGPRDGGASH